MFFLSEPSFFSLSRQTLRCWMMAAQTLSLAGPPNSGLTSSIMSRLFGCRPNFDSVIPMWQVVGEAALAAEEEERDFPFLTGATRHSWARQASPWEEVMVTWMLRVFPHHRREAVPALGGEVNLPSVVIFCASHTQSSAPDGRRVQLRSFNGACFLEYAVVMDKRNALRV